MGKRNMPEAITKSKILLVEGKDEVNLFTELLVNLDLTDVQVIEVSGKDKFPSKLEALVKKLQVTAKSLQSALSGMPMTTRWVLFKVCVML